VGLWGKTGARGGMLEGAGGLLVRCLEFQGEPGRSVEQSTCLDECVCLSSCDLVCWAVDHCCGLPGAWAAVSGVSAVVWVLDEAWVVVWGMVAAGFVTVVGCDMAAGQQGSGHERRGSGGCRGAVGRLGKVCRHFCGARGGFGAGDRLVVAIVDIVGIVDGGCAGIVNDDMVALAVKGRLVMRAAGLFSVWVVASVGSVVVCILKSMQSIVSMFFSEYKCLLSGGSICRAAH
jgi:hypothetical protein